MNKSKYFSGKHLYGQILEFLYNNPDETCSIDNIKSRLNYTENDSGYFNKVIDWLIKDELIVKEDVNHTLIDFAYRISYKGYLFVDDFRSQKRTYINSWITLLISIIAIIVSITAIFHDSCDKVPTDTATANHTNLEGKNNVISDSGNVKKNSPVDTNISKDVTKNHINKINNDTATIGGSFKSASPIISRKTNKVD